MMRTAIALLLLAACDQLAVLGPMIRGKRLAAKAAICAATTETAMHAASNVSWMP